MLQKASSRLGSRRSYKFPHKENFDSVMPYEYNNESVPTLSRVSQRIAKARKNFKISAFDRFNNDIVEGKVSNVAEHKRTTSASFSKRGMVVGKGKHNLSLLKLRLVLFSIYFEVSKKIKIKINTSVIVANIQFILLLNYFT